MSVGRSSDGLNADVIIVGSGAGGAAAAHALADSGLDVLVLEMGKRQPVSSFTQREEEMYPRLFQEAGGRRTVDQTTTILQGQGVGGSTLHNLNLCKRVPAEILSKWSSTHDLPELSQKLDSLYGDMEKLLNVTKITDDQVNQHNSLFRKGCRALGLRTRRLHHNRTGCIGSGFCELGCAYDAKNNAAKTLLPTAEASGVRVLAGHRVQRIRQRRGRVTGVQGIHTQDNGHKKSFVARCNGVVLAASATGSPALALASGLDNAHTGRNLHLHPGTSVGALFATPIEAWTGIPQSVECDAFLHPLDPEKRIWIVPAFSHPAGVAGFLPGIGLEHAQRMRQYRYLAAASPMLHDHGHGRVTATRNGQPRIHYRLDPSDAQALAHGVADTARIWLAAGALEVIVPWAQPVVVSSMAETDALRNHRVRPLDPALVAVHPMGGMALSGNPERGACDPEGRYWGVQGLYVADGSLFPSSTGVPPQLTIYALGRMVGQTVARDLV